MVVVVGVALRAGGATSAAVLLTVGLLVLAAAGFDTPGEGATVINASSFAASCEAVFISILSTFPSVPTSPPASFTPALFNPASRSRVLSKSAMVPSVAAGAFGIAVVVERTGSVRIGMLRGVGVGMLSGVGVGIRGDVGYGSGT